MNNAQSKTMDSKMKKVESMAAIKPDREIEQLYMRQPYKVMDMNKLQRKKRKQAHMAAEIGLISQRDGSNNSSFSKQKLSLFSDTTYGGKHKEKQPEIKVPLNNSIESRKPLSRQGSKGLRTEKSVTKFDPNSHSRKKEAVDDSVSYLFRMMMLSPQSKKNDSPPHSAKKEKKDKALLPAVFPSSEIKETLEQDSATTPRLFREKRTSNGVESVRIYEKRLSKIVPVNNFDSANRPTAPKASVVHSRNAQEGPRAQSRT